MLALWRGLFWERRWRDVDLAKLDCSSHYPAWQSEHPSAASRFVPGGFGENLVFERANEANVCIADTYSVGGGPAPLLLQVSQPRQPCFKLNHRFQLKNFAPETTRLSRTGWYFRVLREGWLAAGDEVTLVERRYPAWTLERLQSVLYRGSEGPSAMNELLSMAELTDEIKSALRKRLAKLEAKTSSRKDVVWTDWKVTSKVSQTPRIASFGFEALHQDDDDDDDAVTPKPGSHVKIRLPNGLVRAYSIVHGSRGAFTLGVARDENSRGGSAYLHDSVHPGSVLSVGAMTAGLAPNAMASSHVFVVAGIGITAFLWLMDAMVAINYNVQLHYAVRSAAETPFRSALAKLGNRVVLYDGQKGERMHVATIVRNMAWNSQVYACGPRRLMDDVLGATQDAGLAAGDVHFEAFSADVGGDAFSVVVANKASKKLVVVEEEETLLEVLQRVFGEGVVGSSCEVGNCGTCKVKVTCGKVEHRGTALSEEDKEGEMLSCVSRGVGKIEIEIGE